MPFRNYQFSFVFLAGILLPGLSAARTHGCAMIPDDPEMVLVQACEIESSYLYYFPERTEKFVAREYRDQIKSLIRVWQQSVGLPEHVILNTQIDVLLSIPDTDPEGAQVRVQGRTPMGNFVIYLEFDPASWAGEGLRVGILNDKTYPESFGFQPGKLIVRINSGTDETQIAQLLAGFAWERIDPQTIHVATPVFEEARARAVLLAKDKKQGIITSILMNYWFEWIAYRGKAFTFSATSR